MKLLLGLIFIIVLFSCSSKPEKPNIILIMSDDMGYECLSINGALHYQTPNLDRLAQNGIKFNGTFRNNDKIKFFENNYDLLIFDNEYDCNIFKKMQKKNRYQIRKKGLMSEAS